MPTKAQQKMNARERRQAEQRRKRNIWIGAIIALAVILVGYFVYQSLRPARQAVQGPPEVASNIETVTTASGLQYQEINPGSGDEVKDGDTVSVHYTGWLTDGAKFDSSKDRDKPFQFQVGAGGVIQGWDEGLVGMKEGGVRRLIIPAALAYGEGGYPPVIPPNATLIFDIELLEILQ
jgi:FKBP-type peptidyl-prolyl cis-trans isomerase